MYGWGYRIVIDNILRLLTLQWEGELHFLQHQLRIDQATIPQQRPMQMGAVGMSRAAHRAQGLPRHHGLARAHLHTGQVAVNLAPGAAGNHHPQAAGVIDGHLLHHAARPGLHRAAHRGNKIDTVMKIGLAGNGIAPPAIALGNAAGRGNRVSQGCPC